MKLFNKKGQADIIGNIISTIPKPIIFLIFILLLTLIVALLSPVFNAFGLFCDSNENVVKLGNSDLFSNLNLLRTLPSASEINEGSLETDRLFVKCKIFYNDSYRYDINSCHYCDKDIYSDFSTWKTLCMGNAFNFENPEDNLSWVKRTLICPFFDCDIPDGYYYDENTSKYECLGDDCGNTLSATLRDEKLAELGADDLYEGKGYDNSYDGVIKFKCSPNLKVKPTIKGIEVFNFTFWMFGILIIILLWGIMRFAKK